MLEGTDALVGKRLKKKLAAETMFLAPFATFVVLTTRLSFCNNVENSRC